MARKSDVSFVKCASYDPDVVADALESALEPLGGMESFVRRGQKVFLKVNLLLAAAPETARTTHPAVVEAVIRSVQAAGAEVFFGDLSGGFQAGGVKKIHEMCGMNAVAENTGATLVMLEKHGFRARPIPGGKKLTEIHTPKFLDDMDVLINLPKLKTHMQSMYTGAVKNMFGFLASRDRTAAHLFSRYSDFSNVLADIYSAVTPDLHIMDAVVGMEGTGPSQGKPVKLGWMLASADGVAMDAVAEAAAGFRPGEVLSTHYTAKRGLGEADLKRITIHGLSLSRVRRSLKRPSPAVFSVLSMFGGMFTESSQIRTRINTSACKKCRRCVEVCPVDAISEGDRFVIDEKKCILCYCCHEMCEYGAVELKKPFLMKLMEIAAKS